MSSATVNPTVTQVIQTSSFGGSTKRGGGRFNNWEEGRDALIKFLEDMKTILNFLVKERIPDEPQALFLDCLPEIEKTINDVINQLSAIGSSGDEILKKLREVELSQKALELKLREFYERLDQSPPHKGLKVGDTILGSLVKVFSVLEPVKEYKEIVESRLENGGDRGLTLLNLSGRERPW